MARPISRPNSKDRRSRCLGHIINLAVKAFLFSTDIEVFKAVTKGIKEETTAPGSVVIKAAQTAWRKKGPVGKLYNIVVYKKLTTASRGVKKSDN